MTNRENSQKKTVYSFLSGLITLLLLVTTVHSSYLMVMNKELLALDNDKCEAGPVLLVFIVYGYLVFIKFIA